MIARRCICSGSAAGFLAKVEAPQHVAAARLAEALHTQTGSMQCNRANFTVVIITTRPRRKGALAQLGVDLSSD